MRIATFNVQNLRLRRDGERMVLSGAKDMDDSSLPPREEAGIDPIDRVLTAAILRRTDADVVALQEVFDQATLDHFHARYLSEEPWPHRICLPGNDGRGFDVALMSRIAPQEVESHATLTPAEFGLDNPSGRNPDEPVFRRDCLSARVGPLTLFICHYKAPYPAPADAWFARRLEALAVRRLVERKFEDPSRALWLILGDLNEPFEEPRGERAILPLIDDFAVDLVRRMPADGQWSFHVEETGHYSRPDALLASPALAVRFPDAVPYYLREGMSRDADRYSGARLPGVGEHRPHASDHAALVVDFEGL